MQRKQIPQDPGSVYRGRLAAHTRRKLVIHPFHGRANGGSAGVRFSRQDDSRPGQDFLSYSSACNRLLFKNSKPASSCLWVWARHQATAVLSLERINLDFHVQGGSLVALESSVPAAVGFLPGATVSGGPSSSRGGGRGRGGGLGPERAVCGVAEAGPPRRSPSARAGAELAATRGENSWPAPHPSAPRGEALDAAYARRFLRSSAFEKWSHP